jgi:hypothetical protein
MFECVSGESGSLEQASDGAAAARADSELLASLKFRLADGVCVEELPDTALIFSESGQEIERLNETGALLVRRLAKSATADELKRALDSLGAEEEAAAVWVQSFLQDLSLRGFLEAEWVEAPSAAAQCRLTVAGVGFQLDFSSPNLHELLWPPFTCLADDGANPEMRLSVSGGGDLVSIVDGNGRVVLVEKQLAAVQLKGMILEEVLEKADYLCALHAAAVTKDGSALLILGPPGAGKTTLLLRLLSMGYDFLADDVTLVHEGGKVTGIPLPPGIKEGSWKFASALGLSVDGLPIHLRPDDLQVRFLAVDHAAQTAPVAVSRVIRVHRRSGENAALKRLLSGDAVTELLTEARSPSGACSEETFRAAAEIVRGSGCFELRYADSADGAALLDEQVQ